MIQVMVVVGEMEPKPIINKGSETTSCFDCKLLGVCPIIDELYEKSRFLSSYPPDLKFLFYRFAEICKNYKEDTSVIEKAHA